ncbi:single-stranded-DNA-specific exonuclease RecJ [Rhodanobacter thiooxydans]|uniref:single-stranded-DNA-specific exonuclease RecJ n=1 Tax=Rhodanobacter thiooxydans TaxID=416169 RepID=UPI001F3F180B|nr:DHHA1 domain-containing protein [Rhodanobacter thiooxydans]UJJ56738.1 DHHA1 domain-containing protein [Rhodanobacter thiooxydans]
MTQTTPMLPTTRDRPIDPAVLTRARSEGFTELQARVIAARVPASTSSLRDHIAPSARLLDSPELLPDIDVAAGALADAVMDPSMHLAGVFDHDADGANAGAVFLLALTEYFGVPRDRIVLLQSHRQREGYGVSDAFVERIINDLPRPCLIATGDQGSSDEPRLARLKAAGFCTVVTDHHGVEGKGPPSALACVNPAREDSRFPDPLIAGVHVMWLTMCAVRQQLIRRGHLPEDAPTLAPLLAWSAVGTTADAVSLARSRNNRAVIRYGLRLINNSKRAPWQAMRKVMKLESYFSTKDISHGVGPRINARGRMADPLASLQFLTTTDEDQADYLAALLDSENEARKVVERTMTAVAMDIASVQAQAGMPAVVVHLPDGHSGVHGITASRIVEAFGRPTCCLSPKQGHPGILTGSLRTVPGVHVRKALAAVATANPGLLLSYGGHAGAGGTALAEADLVRFQDAFCEAVAAQIDPSRLMPITWSDGPLGRAPDMSVIEELDALEPYGREFEPAAFTDRFVVEQVKPVGDGSHLKLQLRSNYGSHSAIWFRAMTPGGRVPAGVGQEVLATYQLAANHFRGRTTVDIQVQAAQVIQ